MATDNFLPGSVARASCTANETNTAMGRSERSRLGAVGLLGLRQSVHDFVPEPAFRFRWQWRQRIRHRFNRQDDRRPQKADLRPGRIEEEAGLAYRESAGPSELEQVVMDKCIVVEDDAFWLSEITAILAQVGVQALPAVDGAEALALARAHPDASMILDVILPEIDGIKVLLELKSIAPRMPVLVVTAGGRLGATYYMKLAASFGAAAQLAKPFTAEQLREAYVAVTQ